MRLLLFLKISLMAAALAGVFYSMRYLRSQEFVTKTESRDSPLAILLGTDGAKAHNWCPTPLSSMALLPKNPQVSASRALNTAADWAALCEILLEPVPKQDMEESFKKIVLALPQSGEPVYLEQNAKGVFRVPGMTFRSQSLEKALKRYDF